VHHHGVAAFKGLKIGQDPITIKHWPQILKATIVRDHDRMLFEEVGVVGWGGNSGFHAVNLAAQFGAKKILLVGIDFTVAYGASLVRITCLQAEQSQQAQRQAMAEGDGRVSSGARGARHQGDQLQPDLHPSGL
jgi:hypothetical protein